MIELIIIILVLLFAFIWTRLHKRKVGDFDSFMDLRWLFPSRVKTVTYDDVQPLLAKRGVCSNFGKPSPWTSQLCECKGYEYAMRKRGTEYCTCGCQRVGHLYKRSPDRLDAED